MLRGPPRPAAVAEMRIVRLGPVSQPRPAATADATHGAKDPKGGEKRALLSPRKKVLARRLRRSRDLGPVNLSRVGRGVTCGLAKIRWFNPRHDPAACAKAVHTLGQLYLEAARMRFEVSQAQPEDLPRTRSAPAEAQQHSTGREGRDQAHRPASRCHRPALCSTPPLALGRRRWSPRRWRRRPLARRSVATWMMTSW